MRRLLPLLFLALAAAGLWWILTVRNRPPEVEFIRIEKRNMVELLSTNGKIEPVEWTAVRSEAAGAVSRILIARGQTVAKDAPLVELESREARAALDSAEARVAQAKAELEVLAAGGRPSEIAALDGQRKAAELELAAATKDLTVLRSLAAKNAATAFEVTQAQDRVDRATAQIASFNARRAALVAPPDKTSALARLHDAEAAQRLATQQLALATIHAPMAGVVYQFDLRPGAFLARGDTVASIGRLELVRALIYVDEPELGRVAAGKPVTITWDAKPGRTWKGSVERMPTQVAALGNRQVGEVQCRIENPDLDLLPGANITAAIRVATEDGAVALPKVALRREDGEAGVLLLDREHNKLVWRVIKTGLSSATDTQVLSGLQPGDYVALPPTDRAIHPDMIVTPVLK